MRAQVVGRWSAVRRNWQTLTGLWLTLTGLWDCDCGWDGSEDWNVWLCVGTKRLVRRAGTWGIVYLAADGWACPFAIRPDPPIPHLAADPRSHPPHPHALCHPISCPLTTTHHIIISRARASPPPVPATSQLLRRQAPSALFLFCFCASYRLLLCCCVCCRVLVGSLHVSVSYI